MLVLKPKSKKDPIIRTTVGLKTSVKHDMELYCAIYNDTYGQELTEGELLNEVFAAFFQKDKAFQAYKEKKQGSAQQHGNAQPVKPKTIQKTNDPIHPQQNGN